MQRTVRIGTVADQDRFRRDDVQRMSPGARVNLLLRMQRQFLAWDKQPLRRVAAIRQLGFPSHAA